jgi:hypothetical protein
VLVIAGLTGVAALVLTVIQRTPAFPLAVTTLGILVALVAALLAIVAVAVGPGGAGGGGAAASRLVGVWLGAGAAVGLVVSLLAAMRDERIPDAAPGMEGAAPEPRTLTLSSSSAAGGRGGEPADGRGAA